MYFHNPAFLISLPSVALRCIHCTVFYCNDTNKTYTIPVPYYGITDFYTIPLNRGLQVSNKSYKC